MSIVNQYGSSVTSRKLVKASDKRAQGLQWQPDLTRDFDDLFSATDWRSVVTQSRVVFANFPVPRSASMQKAWHAVGNAWKPEFTGEDSEWGENELIPFLDLWDQNHDITGEMDLRQSLLLDSIAIDRDGDIFTLLTEDDLGFPKTQKIEAHRIGDRSGFPFVQKGVYAGMKIRNGVIKNKFGRILAYQILGEEESEDMIVDSDSIIKSYDPEWHAQGRGVPAFSAVIPELRESENIRRVGTDGATC